MEQKEKSNKNNLHKKIHAVMNEIGNIQKRGHNKFHNYKYATETDYVEALRPLFKKHGLTVTPRIVRGSLVITGPDEKGQLITTIEVEFKITCIDNPNHFETAIVGGAGQDKGDKGIYKALTGAKKYWASLMFLVDTGDDPERDSEGSSKSFKKKKSSKPVSNDDEF